MAQREKTPSAYKGDIKYELTDELMVVGDMTVEKMLNTVRTWLSTPLHRVIWDPKTKKFGKVIEADRDDMDTWEDKVSCPGGLVKYLQELIYQQEKTGRYLFYFGKAMSQLAPGDMPSWFKLGVQVLATETTQGGKISKGALAEINALKRNWRPHMVRYLLFQGLLLTFYVNAVDRIMEELVERQDTEDDEDKWQEETWNHVIFIEYIVRERWGAYDTNKINDPRWQEARTLHPLHPENQKTLGMEFTVIAYIVNANCTQQSMRMRNW